MQKLFYSLYFFIKDAFLLFEIKQAVLFFVQILIGFYLVFFLYKKTRRIQAKRTFAGVIALLPLVLSFYICFYIFELQIFKKIFDLFFSTSSLALIVLFAPELREFLAEIGNLEDNKFLKSFKNSIDLKPSKENEEIAIKISNALKNLSETRTGALLLFEKNWSEKLYVNPGYKINADISTELILNIFSPKSPLHDGALVIIGSRLHSASVVLPITENPQINPWQYGTRHRAAIGISENNAKVFCLVVSEETGKISLANNGKLQKIDSSQEEIKEIITNSIDKLSK